MASGDERNVFASDEALAEIASAELVSESFRSTLENVCDAVESITRAKFNSALQRNNLAEMQDAYRTEASCYMLLKEEVGGGQSEVAQRLPQYAEIVADAVDMAITYERERQSDQNLGGTVQRWSNVYLRGE